MDLPVKENNLLGKLNFPIRKHYDIYGPDEDFSVCPERDTCHEKYCDGKGTISHSVLRSMRPGGLPKFEKYRRDDEHPCPKYLKFFMNS
ncbi:hypothetical protein ACFLZJ_01500 [Nanoarchaeota archaeon]